MSEENEFNMYKNIVNNYFRTETFEKAKDYCVRDMLNLQNKYFNEHELRKQLLFQVDELQKKVEQSQDILGCINIAYQVHTKDCELLLKDIKKWEKLLDK